MNDARHLCHLIEASHLVKTGAFILPYRDFDSRHVQEHTLLMRLAVTMSVFDQSTLVVTNQMAMTSYYKANKGKYLRLKSPS
jgi:hypothetical protein